MSFLSKGGVSVHLYLGVRGLREAHRADIQAKLLIGPSDVHGGQVHDGQPGRGLSPVLDHRLAPLIV